MRVARRRDGLCRQEVRSWTRSGILHRASGSTTREDAHSFSGRGDGEPLVIAFLARSGLFTGATQVHTALEPLRAELRGLGAALRLIADDGIWRFRADDEIELCASGETIDANSLRALRSRYGARHGALSLFLVDANGTLRFAQSVEACGGEAMIVLE